MSTPQPLSRSAANRANAQLSTGPKTEAGKKRSSRNALRHGLTSQLVVMPSEDADAYQAHLRSFTAEYQPKGATETTLVQALAGASWRLHRVVALESNALLQSASGPAELESQAKTLATLSMHSQRLSRQFESAVAQLRALQKTRRSREKSDLEDLVNIMEMCESEGEEYNPSDDGFVFSPAQIDAALRARSRERRALEAYDYAE